MIEMKKLTILAVAMAMTVTAEAQRLSFGTPAQQKLQIAEMAVAELYVDSVDTDKLVESGIRGMLKELDPHSSYTTAKETKSLTEPLEGSFEGVGIQFNMAQDTLLVLQTVANGPSEKVGILAGDRVVKVNDTIIAGVKMSREEIMHRLRGKKGTKVTLGIVRRGIQDTLAFVVTRDKIPLKTVDASYMIRPQVGYIRIGSFGANTHKEFMECVDSLKRKGMKDLIIDLQENGGGYLQSAVKIANEFLHKQDLIVYTEGRTAPRQEFRADGNGKLLDGKIIVLVNEYSASAAEILSGAIQDQDRGQIVGRRSFGKGLVQRPIGFPDGSMIRLTVAHYYTPSGRCIQKPYEKGDLKDYAQDIEKRFQHGELYSRDSIHFADSLKFHTLRLNRTVYGGGGIMPDFFVPLDTTQYTFYHRQLAAKGVIINQSIKYVDQNRKRLKKQYKAFSDFEANFDVPDELMQELYKEGEKAKVKLKDEDERRQSIPMLKNQLKALIARDLWDMSEYFKIVNGSSHIVQKAIEVLGK
jgi:carboxyl-terminal processing protease